MIQIVKYNIYLSKIENISMIRFLRDIYSNLSQRTFSEILNKFLQKFQPSRYDEKNLSRGFEMERILNSKRENPIYIAVKLFPIVIQNYSYE